jgi:hypothetical protein
MEQFKKLALGSVAGALLFAGIYIIVVIGTSYMPVLLPATGPIVQNLMRMDKWTFDGLRNVFFVAAIAGVIFGLFVVKLYPAKLQKLLLPAGLAIPLILIGLFLYTYAGHVEAPRSIKIADATNSTVNIHLHVPKGKLYSLWAGTTTAYPFSGRIRVLEGVSVVGEFPLMGGSGDGNQVPNGGYCFGLTDFWNTTSNRTSWNQIIKPQKDYDLQIIFDQPPPPSTSIWLHWLQAWKDKGN